MPDQRPKKIYLTADNPNFYAFLKLPKGFFGFFDLFEVSPFPICFPWGGLTLA
jgi:hypothetical protein